MCQSADFTSKSVVLAKYNARAVLQSCNVLNLAAKLVMISYLISFLILHPPPLLTLDHICGDNGFILLSFIWCSSGAVSPEDGGL